MAPGQPASPRYYTLLEADQAGGTSLNRGPAPVRTLARAARLIRDWSSWAGFGLEGGPPTHVEQSAELQLAYPTFTEAVSVAAQMVCRTLGIGRFQQVWSYLGSDE